MRFLPWLGWWGIVASALAAMALAPAEALAQIQRAYTTRFTANATGDIIIRGNTLATCTAVAAVGAQPAPPPACAATQAAGATFTGGVNNNYVMAYVDVDGDPSTFNSSTSTISLPTGATVLWAGLYWSGRSTSASRGSVLFRTPATAGYASVNASTVDVNGVGFSGIGPEYQGFADVTAMVQAAGAGSYTVANVQATVGTAAGNDYAGWALVVVVQDGAKPFRNLTIFDGFGNIAGGSTVTTNVSGFLAPATGTPTARVGVVAWEGDRGWAGAGGTAFQNDKMQVNGVDLQDGLNPANDFFNSTISETGAYVQGGQNPAFTNQLGMDAKQVSTTAVPAGASSASIAFTTTGDQYLPGVITFLVDLFNPVINGNVVKLVTDENGGLLSTGDTLRYDLTVANTGQDGALNVVLIDSIPAGTTYVPGSLQIVSGAGAGAKTDAAGDDQGEFDATGSKRIVVRLGTGATSSAGGTLAAGATAAVRFRVRVNDTIPAGFVITNQAVVTATSQTLGSAINARSRDSLTGGGGTPPTNVPVAGPNLTVTKTHPADFTRGGTGAYTITVSNVGNANTTASPIVMTDTVPVGLVPTTATGTGWSCTVTGQVVACTLAGGLTASQVAAPITLNVTVPGNAPASLTNVARVSGGGDNTPGNNAASDLTVTLGAPDLHLTKLRGTPTFTIGTPATWVLSATNGGSAATADSIRMTDTLATGLTFVSGTGSGFTCGNAGQVVSCFRAPGTTLAIGDSVTVTLTVNVLAAAAPSVSNRAWVRTVGDPNALNDSASVVGVTVNAPPDLQLAKVASSGFSVGANGTYTLTVTNVGGLPTTGVITVVDSLSAGLTFVSGTGGNFTCVNAAPLVTCTRPASPALAPTASAAITLTVAVGAAASPAVNNLARASTAGDINAANDTAKVVGTTVVPAPDLALTKASLFTTYVIGDTAQYRLRVTNVGTGPTTGVITITDTLPATLTGLGSLPSTFSCGAVANLVTCTRAAPMLAGDTASVVIGATINPGTTSPMANRAWVSTALDASALNDSASAATVPVTATPDLLLVKRAVGTFTVGQPGQFQLVVRNVALSPTTGTTTVLDTLPAGLTYASFSGAGWSCPAPTNLSVVSCSRTAAILAQDSSVLTITVNVAAAALPSVNNRARTSTPGEINLANNVAQSGAVAVATSPDLSMVKSAVGAFLVGSPATYTLTVRNVGTGVTTDTIVVLDSLPATLAFVSATGPSFTCGVAGSVVRCTRTAPLAVNATAAVTVVVTPGVAAVPSVVNVARVSTTGDASAANDRAAITTGVSGLVNVAVAKTGGDTLNVGATATYTVTATNVGSLPAPAGFTVVDSLPAGLIFQSAAGTGFACANAGQVVTCTATAALAVGSATPITVQVLVTKAAFPAVSNRARAFVPNDADTTDNRAVKASVVRGTVDVDLKKTAAAAQFTSGLDNTWILRVANRGNVPTTGTVTVVDTLAAGLTFTSGTATGWSCTAAGQVVTCTSSTPILDADSVLITLKTRAATSLTGNITNCATAAAPLDGNAANNRSCATVAVIGDFRLSVQKVSRAQVVDVGGTNDYTVVVKNIGASPVPAVQLNDVLPQGFTYQLGTSRLDGAALPDPSGGAGPALTWPLGTLNPGEQRTVTYRVKVGPNLRNGTSVNKASASSGTLVAQANNAAAAVVVRRGVFTDRGVIVGKVYAHCDCGDLPLQQPGELGIPGVRVYMEDGTSAITDVEGKYNFWDASSGMHVVKVDQTTLPAGARLVVTSNRNALDPNSRFVDLKGGQLAVADFATAYDADVITEVRARRRQGEPETPIAAGTVPGPAKVTASAGEPMPLPGVGPDVSVKGTAQVSATVGQAVTPASGAATTTGSGASTMPARGAGTPIGGGANAPAAAVAPLAAASPASAFRETSRWEGMREGDREAAPLPAAPPPIALPVLTDRSSNLPATPLAAALRTPGSPVAAGKAELVIAGTTYPADGTSAIPIVVRLTDAKGTRLTGRVPVTLEASLGRWLVSDVDAEAQGTQVIVTDGEGTFRLVVPGQPGKGEVRVTAPMAEATVSLTFVPAQRPLVVAGVLAGRIEMNNFSGGSLVTSAPDAAFESRLASWSFAQDSGKVRGGLRAALFAKGSVGEDKLLTLGFDSERDDNTQQFRDISPEEMYPTYGDGSLREFDGQSQRRLYARLDRGASFTRFGDYNTMRAGDARLLGAWDRTLNGVQHHEEGSLGAGNVYLARGTARQVIDELPGRGISGPYFLSRPNAVINSERVELLTRDRNQPALILSAKPMARFADYTVEPFTGRLLFRAPVPSLDANFNPVSIRVTYELDQGGTAYNTYGADATLNIGSRLAVGGIAALDENPLDSLKLFGANASLRLFDKTTALVEVAQATGMGGQEGRAGRFELRHASDGIEARLYGTRAGLGFANRSATFGNGRQELGFHATVAMAAQMRLLAEAIETEDLRTGGKRDGALVSLERNFGSAVRAELGYRWAKETGSASAGTLGLLVPPSFSAIRAKLTMRIPGNDKSSLFAEAEKDVSTTLMRASVGAEYGFAQRARAYVRHEWVDGYAGPYALTGGQAQQNTVFGIDADYAQNAQVFSEYRERDAINGRDAEASIGLRNRWALAPGLLFNTSLERVAPLAGAGQGNATAVTGALEWTRPATTKATMRAEWRRAAGQNGYLFSVGIAEKLARDWTLLTRGLFDQQPTIGDRLRTHVGLAWRQTDRTEWNGLLHYQFNRENLTAGLAPASGYDAHIIAGLLNWQPTGRLVLSGRLAAKFATDRSNGFVSTSDAEMIMGRATYDLTTRWDAGVTTSLLLSDGNAARQYGLGLEVGRIVLTNLRLAAGYNMFGYRDRDLSAFGYTMKGAYLDFAFKFDETLFGRGATPAAPAARK
ncbi:MAG: DUF11 domain-containing protein [Gemmatimonadetes bacterium]|nr:DUF11 domain-containing protein [Gemmatimonadota bacterium]